MAELQHGLSEARLTAGLSHHPFPQEPQKWSKYFTTKAPKSVKASGSPKDKPALLHFTGVKGPLQKAEDKQNVSLLKGLRKQEWDF